MKWIIIGLLISTQLYANIQKAPKNFDYKNGKAIFVDFKSVESLITYELDNEKATAVTNIIFENTQEGYPIFDLKGVVLEIEINGKKVSTSLVEDPTSVTKYQVVSQRLKIGEHRLTVINEITENISFDKSSVQSAFWMSDLGDRKYLEKYIPSNIEYDQFTLSLDIRVVKANKKEAKDHEVFANGKITKLAKNHFRIVYPNYFTTSSVYYHLSKKDKFKKLNFQYTSKLSDFPVVIYSRTSWSLNKAKQKTIEVLNELESKYGKWAHPSLTIYQAGSGGMEYSGATITSMMALGHEITHSYFARGVMPIDGNSGWIDEAIASWRDEGEKTLSSPGFNSTNISGHSPYKRYTDTRAYYEGADFMAYLNYRLKNHGGLKNFLANLYKKYVHSNISTEIFITELENYSGEDFKFDFDRYIFGKYKSIKLHSHKKENPYHPILSKEELLNLL